MNKLYAIQVCREVARQGGFTPAGRCLNISTPSVSRLVSELEDDLGVRLFQRSTRRIGLTEEGEIFLNRAAALVDELDTISNEMRERRSTPHGHLRISSVVAFGQERIAPAVPGFLARYPMVTVDLHLENRHVDLINENFDLAIRVGSKNGLASSGLVARKIYEQRLIFVASTEYIRRHGAPESLEEVSEHRTVAQITGNWGKVNYLSRGGKRIEFRMPQTFKVSSPNAALNAVRSGQVLGLIGDFLAKDLIAGGKLQLILPDYSTEAQPIYAVFAHRTYMPAKIRAFIDFLAEEAGTPAALQDLA